MIPWNVIKLRVLPGHRLEVSFADGVHGTVDMSHDDFSGVFAPLADEAYFARATVRDGVIVWPNGVDIASDAIYQDVASGLAKGAARPAGAGPSSGLWR